MNGARTKKCEGLRLARSFPMRSDEEEPGLISPGSDEERVIDKERAHRAATRRGGERQLYNH